MSSSGWRLAREGLANYPLRKRPVLVGRRMASRGLDALGIRHPWVRHRPNPASPRVLPEFRLFAIVGTWMEADVIEATVRNAFTQGLRSSLPRRQRQSRRHRRQRRSRRRGAGPSVLDPTRHDEGARIRIMNEVVNEVSSTDGSRHIWWLWLDADEFPHGPRGLTHSRVPGSARRLVPDRRNPLPQPLPEPRPGVHPRLSSARLPTARGGADRAEVLAVASQASAPTLRPRRRARDHSASPASTGHRVPNDRSSNRPTRSFSTTPPIGTRRRRFRRLVGLFSSSPALQPADPADSPAMIARLRSLDAVYAQDWDAVDISLAPGLKRPRARPRPWTELVEPEHHTVKRWYSAERLDEAIARGACQAA